MYSRAEGYPKGGPEMLDRASGPRQGHGEQGTELRVECLALEGNRIWGKKGGVCGSFRGLQPGCLEGQTCPFGMQSREPRGQVG